MRADGPTPTAEPNVTPLIDVLYGRAVEAMDVSRAAGADRIGLVSERRGR